MVFVVIILFANKEHMLLKMDATRINVEFYSIEKFNRGKKYFSKYSKHHDQVSKNY